MKFRLIGLVFFIFLFIILLDLISVASGGGAAVPISTVDLTEEGEHYNVRFTRLKFEFEEKLYAVQVRRVKQEYVWFLVMTLDMDKQDDITAYSVDNSFNLSIGETKEIDLNKDGINDIFIQLDDIVSNNGSTRSADFSIKKINSKESENPNENVGINTEEVYPDEVTEPEVQDSISKPVIALNQEPEEHLTYLNKIMNFFKELFK